MACLESSPLSHHAFFSVSSGTFLSLLTVPIAEMGQTHNHGLRVGMFFTVVALGALVGPPISGAINVATGGYNAVGIYAGMYIDFAFERREPIWHPGSVIMASVILLIAVRYLLLRRLWGKV